jgi:hypothetical protein
LWPSIRYKTNRQRDGQSVANATYKKGEVYFVKKILFSLLALAMITTVSFGQTLGGSSAINMSVTVNKYIETMPAKNWNLGGTFRAFGTEIAMAGSETYNLAYANCGFSVTVSGSNLVPETKPRFAMQESGAHASGFDTLPTWWILSIVTNGDYDSLFPLGALEAQAFPFSKNYTETPHNGQVGLMLFAWVNNQFGSAPDLPTIRGTSINPAYSIRDSADSGLYKCAMVVTLTAL